MENVFASHLTSPLLETSPRSTDAISRGARASRVVGRALTGILVAFFLFDAAGKLLLLAPVVAATQQLGFAVAVIRPLGLVLALATLLHLFARTRLLGALLLTAYLGGATATQVHAGRSSFWFPVAFGAIFWLAYFLRSPRLRALLLTTDR
jgi:DoxX-like family